MTYRLPTADITPEEIDCQVQQSWNRRILVESRDEMDSSSDGDAEHKNFEVFGSDFAFNEVQEEDGVEGAGALASSDADHNHVNQKDVDAILSSQNSDGSADGLTTELNQDSQTIVLRHLRRLGDVPKAEDNGAPYSELSHHKVRLVMHDEEVRAQAEDKENKVSPSIKDEILRIKQQFQIQRSLKDLNLPSPPPPPQNDDEQVELHARNGDGNGNGTADLTERTEGGNNLIKSLSLHGILAEQILKSDRRLKTLDPLKHIMQNVCKLTGFSYGEIWQRPQKAHSHRMGDANSMMQSMQEGRSRFSIAGSRSISFETFPGLHGAQGNPRRISVLPRRYHHDPRKSTETLSNGRTLSKQTTQESAMESVEGSVGGLSSCFHRLRSMLGREADEGGGGNLRTKSMQMSQLSGNDSPRPSMAGEGWGDMGLDLRLRWAGMTWYMPEAFEESQEEGYIKPGWESRLTRFMKQASSKLSWYEKGKGFPGAVWGRKKLDWHDLSFLPDDDFLAGDPRVRSAKTLFDISAGVPVLDPDTGHLYAVMMFYRAKKKKMHRINANWKALSKNPNVREAFSHAAEMAYYALQMQESISHFEFLNQSKPTSAGIDVTLDLEEEGMISKEPSVSEQKEPELEAPKSFLTTMQHFWIKYFKKFKGQPTQKPTKGHTWLFVIWTIFGSFISFLCVTGVEQAFRRISFDGEELGFKQGKPLWPLVLINSMAAVAGMLFAAPTSPLIQPRNVIGGHIITCSAALCVDYLSNPVRGIGVIPTWVATPLAPAIGVFIMCKVGLLHPPACAAAVIFMVGEPEVKNMDWLYIICPVCFDCAILTSFAVVINNLSPDRTYPLYW